MRAGNNAWRSVKNVSNSHLAPMGNCWWPLTEWEWGRWFPAWDKDMDGQSRGHGGVMDGETDMDPGGQRAWQPAQLTTRDSVRHVYQKSEIPAWAFDGRRDRGGSMMGHGPWSAPQPCLKRKHWRRTRTVCLNTTHHCVLPHQLSQHQAAKPERRARKKQKKTSMIRRKAQQCSSRARMDLDPHPITMGPSPSKPEST